MRVWRHRSKSDRSDEAPVYHPSHLWDTCPYSSRCHQGCGIIPAHSSEYGDDSPLLSIFGLTMQCERVRRIGGIGWLTRESCWTVPSSKIKGRLLSLKTNICGSFLRLSRIRRSIGQACTLRYQCEANYTLGERDAFSFGTLEEITSPIRYFGFNWAIRRQPCAGITSLVITYFQYVIHCERLQLQQFGRNQHTNPKYPPAYKTWTWK